MSKLPAAPQRITTGFAFSYVERALKEGLSDRRFGKAEMDAVLAFFGCDPPECVYCGSPDVKRWDHLVPVTKGGETVLGNMVPSCARCDDSKQHLRLDEWVCGNARFSPKSLQVRELGARVERIQAYVQHFGYTPREFEARLADDELVRLQNIRDSLASLRADIERLIADYRVRTGHS